MTKRLHTIIERLIHILKYHDRYGCIPTMKTALEELKVAYVENRAAMTETARRIEFLHECLENGVSKREAARMLVIHDPRVGQKTAETLVYMNFSGQYQTTLRGRRLRKSDKVPAKALVEAPPDVSNDEDIL